MSYYISLVNEWCQKNNRECAYEFESNETLHWSCSVASVLPGMKGPFSTHYYPNKKQAKEIAAKFVYEGIMRTEANQKLVLPLTKTIIMIDGDQRMDCIKWLLSDGIIIPESVQVHIFLSPTAPTVTLKPGMGLHVSKTTNRDSSDALLLIKMGTFFHLFPYFDIIILSSDHILAQAALDFAPKTSWFPNLTKFQEAMANLHVRK